MKCKNVCTIKNHVNEIKLVFNGYVNYKGDYIVIDLEELGNEIGIRFVSVDAYNNAKTINFYNHNQFVELESVKKKKRRNIPMYRDICERLN